MKSRVDIFRPLAAATRSCRPDSATSIFRKINKNIRCGGVSGDEDDASIVVSSVPPGNWPPTALSSASEGTIHKPLKTSAPLSPGTTASSGDDGLTASPLREERRTTQVTPRPSYYKIELDPKNDGVVQLTAGDDASVQFTPEDHNRQLEVATAQDNDSPTANNNAIVRASPVVELSGDASERHRQHRSSQQKWTISDSGRIMTVPPAPSRVALAHDYHHKKSVAAGGKGDIDLESPPKLVKANSHGSSSTHSIDSDSDDDDSVNSLKKCSSVVEEEGAEVASLESPPRMTRSVIYPQSLFQDSVGSSSQGSSAENEIHCVKQMSQAVGCAGSNSTNGEKGKGQGAGCGTRSFDFFGTLLDVFSLNGPCCRSSNADGTASSNGLMCR